MNITITKSVLQDALQKVIGVIEKKLSIPILANVLVEIKSDQVLFTGTDMEIEVTSYVPGEFEGNENAFTVSGKRFFDFVRTLSDVDRVALTYNDCDFRVKADKTKILLKTLPAQEFPRINFESGKLEFTLDAKLVQTLFDKVSFSMAIQDSRHCLNGLLMEIAPQQLRLVATDGHRLAISSANIELGLPFHQCIIPRKAVLELQKILSAENGTIVFVVGESFMMVKGSGFNFATKLIEGKFPNYNNVIPTDANFLVKINRDKLKQAFSRASVLASNKFNSARVLLQPNQFILEVKNPDADEAQEIIDAFYEGPQLDIGFNTSYFIDVLQHIDDDEVEINFAENNNCAFFQHKTEVSQQIYVVMPVLF